MLQRGAEDLEGGNIEERFRINGHGYDLELKTESSEGKTEI